MLEGGWILVLITASNREEAENIARELVKDKLVACVNIVDNIKSIYWWKGEIEDSRESLLLVKTRINVFDRLVKKVKSIHSYEVPEIIALPIITGYKEYLKWLSESLK
ncbi:MAG: cytochrome C biogenesis protein CcdA [Desulfurococcales archaeon ex4484_58]|nr:MAG: cytochrome C biogenesis protein CcdA [Desulfurococcales archaeon ex4484_58]